MTSAALIGALSKRAHAIAVLTVLGALIGAWTRGPIWLFDALAAIVGTVAFVLWLTSDLPRQMKSKEQLGFSRNRDWIAYEISGRGNPRGLYLLGIFLLVGVFFTLGSPYAPAAFTGFALLIVWGRANRRYPADEIRPKG